MAVLLSITFALLAWALRIYTWFLWGRFILEWVRVLNPRFRPRGVWIVVVEFVFTITDPPIKFFRKVLPPIRLGQVQLDLGWMVTMLICIILLGLIPG